MATNRGGEAGTFAMRDETEEWSNDELDVNKDGCEEDGCEKDGCEKGGCEEDGCEEGGCEKEDDVTVFVVDEQDGRFEGEEDPGMSLDGLKPFLLLIESPVDEPTPSSPSSSLGVRCPVCRRFDSSSSAPSLLLDASGRIIILFPITGLESWLLVEEEDVHTSRGSFTSFDAWLISGRSDSLFLPSDSLFVPSDSFSTTSPTSTSTFTTMSSSILTNFSGRPSGQVPCSCQMRLQ